MKRKIAIDRPRPRKLAVRSETLRNLGTADLTRVHGMGDAARLTTRCHGWEKEGSVRG